MNTLFYTYFHSPIGVIRISGTDRFICEVHFMKDDEISVSDLKSSPVVPEVINTCVEQLKEYFEGGRKNFTVPVYQDGTDFQQIVWNELLGIPFAKTISYLTLSKRIGDVKAIRAVGSTNAKNKIGIIVPCHRVIGANQDLVGYAGGLWRKKWLLDHEMKIAYGVQTLFELQY
ncbi:MAG TPA: methylated-DNA--[protein]-cysteine S-methyltransferase [Chitinophagaceae bacterium]|nr:methylated-DNA--[protein]-cysteine S-methyltransferase [Chitinophagaceae bacterium]